MGTYFEGVQNFVSQNSEQTFPNLLLCPLLFAPPRMRCTIEDISILLKGDITTLVRQQFIPALNLFVFPQPFPSNLFLISLHFSFLERRLISTSRRLASARVQTSS